MLFDPPVRNVDPFQIRTGIRTMTELVLTLTIHDKDITMAKPERITLIAWTGLTLPFEKPWVPKLTETMSFVSPALSQTVVHHRCAILHAKTFPDKGSGSQQQARPLQHTRASLGEREPSTV